VGLIHFGPNFPSISEMVKFISKLAQDHNYDRFIPIELIEVLRKIKYPSFEIVSSNTKEFSITNKNLDNLIEYLENDLEMSQKIDLDEFETTFNNIRLNIDFKLFKSKIKESISNMSVDLKTIKIESNDLAVKLNALDKRTTKQEISKNEVNDVIKSNENACQFLFQLLNFVNKYKAKELARNQQSNPKDTNQYITIILKRLRLRSENDLLKIEIIRKFLDEIKNACDDRNKSTAEKIAFISKKVKR